MNVRILVLTLCEILILGGHPMSHILTNLDMVAAITMPRSGLLAACLLAAVHTSILSIYHLNYFFTRSRTHQIKISPSTLGNKYKCTI